MSVIRKDPLSNSWVIFAEERYQHPAPVAPPVSFPPAEECPFCPGHEHMTPPELVAVRPGGSEKDAPDWSVRAVPNQYAVLRIEGKLERRGDGLYDMMNGIGAHEIVIETPEHEASLPDYPVSRVQEILWVFRERAQDLVKDPRFRYIQIFRNYGETAGANISHPHSHIVALPILPRWVREEITQAYDHWGLKERCLFCDIVVQDLASKRLVYENESFVALEPFASKFPFETWIYPRVHSHTFADSSDTLLASLADVLRVTIGAFSRATSHAPFNIVFHSAPMNPERAIHHARAQIQSYYHWHIEIIPRATKVAGFEFGTGFYINSLLPEEAAETLRSEVAVLRSGGS
jgi:UDPglucose--hexose-1-phosphate uridylyltransferase